MSSASTFPALSLKNSVTASIRWALYAGVLTAAITLFMPNYYKSEMRLLPVGSKGIGGDFGNLSNAAAAFGVNLPNGDGGDANFVDVLGSRWMRERLLQTTYQFHARRWRFGQLHLESMTLLDYLKSSNLDRGVHDINNIYFVVRDLKSKIITVGAETKSPELSQMIVQRVEKLLETFLREKGRTRGGAKAMFAEARLAEARNERDEAEQGFLRFLENNHNFQGSQDPSIRLKGARLEAELRLQQQLVTTLAMNREQALLEEKNDIPILNVLDQGNLPIEKSRPTRSVIVITVTVLVGVASWLWRSRVWLLARLSQGEDHEAMFTSVEIVK